jgi:hypothetical protein
VQRDCLSKCVLVVKEDGGYSYASDFDEYILALLAADDAEHYESLIVQRVLSAQMEKAE